MKYKTDGYALVDVFTMAYVGGDGTEADVAAHLVRAVNEYNAVNGTRLVFEMDVKNA